MSCLAVECYLKAKVEVIEPQNVKLGEHDSIYLYRFLISKYPTVNNLAKDITLCRKYHNEARYSNLANPGIYNKEFADRFIRIIAAVEKYVDEECIASFEDLRRKFNSESS